MVCELILNHANEIKALKQGKTKILRVYFNETLREMLKFVPNDCVELRYSRGRFFYEKTVTVEAEYSKVCLSIVRFIAKWFSFLQAPLAVRLSLQNKHFSWNSSILTLVSPWLCNFGDNYSILKGCGTHNLLFAVVASGKWSWNMHRNQAVGVSNRRMVINF